MDIQQIRQTRLAQLLAEVYDNKKTTLANRLDIQPSYLSRLSTKNEKSRRNIGDKLARRIEEVSDKEYGWLDRRNDWEVATATSPSSDLVEPASLDVIIRIPIVGDTQAGR